MGSIVHLGVKAKVRSVFAARAYSKVEDVGFVAGCGHM